MQRRNRPGKRPSSSSSLRWLWWLAGLILVSGVLLVLLAPTLITSYIRSYLQTDDFRQKAEQLIAARTGGSAHIAPLNWNDDTATAVDLSLANTGWTMDAGGLHAALDFGAIQHGKWSIQNAGADDLTLRHSAIVPLDEPHAQNDAKFDGSSDGIPAFLRRYIPTETSISGFEVHRFLFEQGGWQIAETQLRLGNWRNGETSVSAKLNGGKLVTPLNAPEQKKPLQFDLTRAALRVGDSQLQVSDATLRWKQESEVTLRGSLKYASGAWQTFTHVKAVPLDEFLDEWWKQRLSGRVEGDLEMSGARNAPLSWKADLSLKDGALVGLPILDKLVTYTNTHRFKRLVLDICSASFRPQGDSLRIENIIVQSNGLLRIEGTLQIRGRTLDGDFMLGVTPETLTSIPGASRRVFVENNPGAPPGLQWTRVHIVGTLDAPQEDLSNRLIGAAGMSLLFDTPGAVVGQGAEMLLKPVLGEDMAKTPGQVINGASGLIENGVNAGSGLINRVLPIFPGK
ncbi:MAG: hypothetical protein B7Z37_11775 [Verrucomicrobia bacterium 12-59-8]|nr:MAG: hypothetical protein B7Z37_11775 [Verrucomicrobia bacterium 12-59-8]